MPSQFIAEINHLGAESESHPQPRLFGVNGEGPSRAHQLRAGDAEEPHGTATEDRDSVGAFNHG